MQRQGHGFNSQRTYKLYYAYYGLCTVSFFEPAFTLRLKGWRFHRFKLQLNALWCALQMHHEFCSFIRRICSNGSGKEGSLLLVCILAKIFSSRSEWEGKNRVFTSLEIWMGFLNSWAESSALQSLLFYWFNSPMCQIALMEIMPHVKINTN